MRWRMSVIAVSSLVLPLGLRVLGLRVLGLRVLVLVALDRLGDALDALEPGVPCRADGPELGGGPAELGLIDAEPASPGRRSWRGPDRRGRARRGASPPPDGSPAGARSGSWRCRCLRSAAGRASGAGSGRPRPTTGRRPPSRSCAGSDLHRVRRQPGQVEVPAGDVVGVARRQPSPRPSRARGSRSRSSAGASRPSTGSSSKTTSSELPGAATSPSACVHRNEKRRGGTASTTVNCTHVRSCDEPPKAIRPAPPASSLEVGIVRPPLPQVLRAAHDVEDDLGRRLDVDLPLDRSVFHARHLLQCLVARHDRRGGRDAQPLVAYCVRGHDAPLPLPGVRSRCESNGSHREPARR